MRRRLIQLRAKQLLEQFEIVKGPVPVDRIARALGAEIRKQATSDDQLSGFLLRDLRTGRVVIGINPNHHSNRQRFTIAHELGHFVLHDFKDVHVDKAEPFWAVKLRNNESSRGTNNEEREANLFAAEILMPRELLRQDIHELTALDEESIKRLAKRYEVSSQAITFRLAYLGYIQQ